MNGPQSGIFALGNPSHAYLEFDLQQDRDSSELVTALADVREPRTTIGGVNLVSGFRPSCGARSHRTVFRMISSASTTIWSAPTTSLCPRHNTMRCYGCLAARTT